MDCKHCGKQARCALPRHCMSCLSNWAEWWEDSAAMSRAGLQALQPREGLKEDFLYLFAFSNVSNAGILVAIFM